MNMNIPAVLKSLPTDSKLDDIWIDCICWSFKWNFEKLDIGDRFNSRWKKLENFGIFSLEVKKASPTAFAVGVVRESENFGRPPDAGYYLECSISVVGYDEPRDVHMSFGMYRATKIFQYNEIDMAREGTEIWTVKCVFKMCEVNVLKNEASRTQNELIESLKTQEQYEKNNEDMAFLLKRKSLDKVFTGRQNDKFAHAKAGFIARTLQFAGEIAKKVRSKRMNTNYEPQISPKIYLGSILGKDIEGINKQQVLYLYLEAHRYGLSYLANECADFMLHNLDAEYLVCVLAVSELTSDSELSSKVARIFMANSKIILQTRAWETLIAQNYPIMQCIVDIVRQKFKSEANRHILRRERMLVEEKLTRNYVKSRVFGDKKKRWRARKRSLKRKITQKSSREQCPAKEFRGSTEEANVHQPMDKPDSNMEQHVAETSSVNEKEKMGCIPAYVQYGAPISATYSYIREFKRTDEENANIEPIRTKELLMAGEENSNTKEYSVEQFNTGEKGECVELISSSQQFTVGEKDSSTEQYSVDELVATSEGEESIEGTSADEKDVQLNSSTDQNSSNESDCGEENNCEQNRPEKYSMEEKCITE